MHTFYIKNTQKTEKSIIINGEDAHHIGFSLRMRPNEQIKCCDENGMEYLCKITDITSNEVKTEILEEKISDKEPPYKITLVQAIPKGDKSDFIVQKAVECGATEILFTETKNCVAKLGEKIDSKLTRWRKIAEEAAKQCGRGIVPMVNTISYANLLKQEKENKLLLFCYEGENTEKLSLVLSKTEILPKEVMIVVGSEGGFTPKEAEDANNAGFHMVGLGKRILRAETAGIFALSCLAYHFE